MVKIKYLKLLFSLAICQLTGIIGSFFTITSLSNWYLTLNKPSFNPPNWIFGPVWTILYLLMGISLYLIWKNYNKISRTAIILFSIQLTLNLLWTILFFGLKNVLFAFIEIIILWIFILLTIITFYKQSKTAAFLLIPYIVWVSFAAILNFSILYLN